MATRIIKTQVTGTSTQKFTLSCWIKKLSTPSTDQVIYDSYADGNNRMTLYFNGTTGNLSFYGDVSGTTFVNIKTNRLFRDTSGWYNIVLRVDTTQGNVSQRVRIYVNGVEETSFATASYPTTGFNLPMGTSSYQHAFGWYSGGGSSVFDGSMSHLNFIDGEDRDASYFGETDSTTGEWKIKTSPTGINYGNNGFFILKDGNSLTDQSGKGNSFTLNTGTLTKTEDNPSNVFNILSPLYLSASKWNFIQGHLRANGWANGVSQTWRSIYGTLGASSGKYYFEMKCDDMYSGDTGNIALGIVSDDQVVQTADNSKFFNGSTAYAYAGNGQKLNNDDSIAGGDSYGSSFTTNDIISCAYDLDNGKIYWAKNGTWANSGDPTSGSTGTGSAFNLTANLTYLPAVCNYYDDDRWSFNFGNGYFGATAVSSAGTNASGNGIFEYDVPTGYTALSTKGLNL